MSYICHFVLILQFPGIFLAEECSEVTQGGLGEELGAREEKIVSGENSQLLVKHAVYHTPYYDH